MSKIVQKIINANAQKSGSAVVGIAGARALNASEFLDDKHTVDTQSIDQATSVIEASLKNRYDYINYYAGGFNVARHLFNKNEQGVWFNPSDMTAGKAGWRRNLLTYSEQLTTSPWSANEASLESATPPSGIGLAWKLKETGNSGVHFVGRVLNTVLSASVQHTLSVYAKAGERNILSIVGESTATTLCDFDLSAGTAHPAASATGTITSVGDGWYRCSMTWTATASPSTTYFATKQSLAGGLVFTGTLNSGLFLAAAQLERASTPSEYQPITDFSTEFKAAYPTHTLYQDSNGVTPVTASGQPVGLILDQSRGGLSQIGAELLTVEDDRTFGSDTGFWTKSTGVSITGGQCVFTAVASGNGVYRNSASLTTTGKWYQITFTVVSISAGNVRAYARNGINGPLVSTPGTYTHFVLCGSADNFTGIFTSGASTTCVIDNISIKEIPGNHAYQTTSASRPTLARIPSSGRRNLLTRTEDFDNAAWTKINATVSANATTAPDGTTTADTLIDDATNADHKVRQGVAITSGTTYTVSVYAKANTLNFVWIYAGTPNVGRVFNLATGATGGTVGNAPTSSAISAIGNGWYRCSITYTAGATSTQNHDIGTSPDGTSINYIGTGQSAFIWGAQLETGSSPSNYQKVVSTHDVTESGFNDLWHLVFDGSDDSLVTNSISFNTWTQETRRNLLIATEDFSNSAWIKTNLGVSGNTMTPDATLGQHRIYQQVTHTSPHIFSVEAKANGYNFISLAYAGGLVGQSIFFDLSNGTISGSLANHTPTITPVGDGWYRCSLALSASAASTAFNHFVVIRNAASIADYSGDGVSGVLLRYPQLEQGNTLTTYQRVGTDEMTVIAGVRKLSDAAPGACVELTSSPNVNNGTFTLLVPASASATIGYYSKGTGQQGGDATISAPVTAVCSGLSDISSDVTQLRINGTLQINDTDDQGTGNYSDAAIYIGRRGGAAVPFNGHLYQLIVRGKTTSTDQIEQVEDFVKRKSGLSY